MIYCGIDGGGTKTRVIVTDGDIIIADVLRGPSSIDTVPLEETIRVINSALEYIYNNHDIPLIDSIFVGLGGIASNKQIEVVNNLVSKLSFIKENGVVNSGNDMTNAYLASCSGRNNITVIIGTGAVAFGVDEKGKSHRTNGIHYLEGDFGSGYDIGVRALKKLSLSFDKRIEQSPLTKYLTNKFNIITLSDLIKFMNKYKNDRTFIASIAKIVVEFAIKDDAYAVEIINEAADEILLSIIGVDKSIVLKNREIGIVGNLGKTAIYFNLIKRKIIKYDSSFNIHISNLDPVFGSLVEAKRQINEIY